MVRKKVASSRLAADEQVAKSWSSGETNNNGLLIDNDEGEVSHNVELDEKYTEDAEDCESFQIDHARISVSVNLAPPIEEVCAHHLSYFELSFAGNDSATNNFRTFLEEDAVKLTIAWTSPELTLGECGWLIAAGKAVQVKVGRRARQNVERKYARIRFTDEQSLLLPALKKCSKLFALWSTFPASPHCIRIAVGVQRSAFDQDAIFGSQTAVDSINAVMAFFFGEQLRNIPRFETQEWFRESLEQFYASLKQHRKKVKAPLSNHDPQHADLVPLLRPYQREAVQWMIERENNPALPFGPWVLADKFARITPTNGEPFYYSPVVGSFLAEKPRHPTILPGGILADEMGLGKTVEVIAVMLNNPRDRQSISNQTSSDHHQDEVENVLNELISHVVATVDGRAGLRSPMRRDRKRMSAYICYDAPKEAPSTSKRRRTAPAHSVAEVQCISCKKWSIREKVGWNLFASDDELYTCPTCVVAQDPIPGKATLIVSPSTICHQWYEELKRHVGGRRDFKIDVYRGLSVDGFKHPLYLAQCDVVICSYETLRGELNFVNLNERSEPWRKCNLFMFGFSVTLRRPKVYRIAPSPLTAVNFWRICLDEAQMVESSSSQAAAMCLELNAVNRWCVTGTPIHKSIGELHGLITFLGVEPYYVKAWWERMIWLPYINKDWTPLLDLMARILWRNTKADVHDQLNIPAQLERTTWLQFSPIEEQFYRQTADVCSVNAARVFSRYDDYSLKLFELSRQAVDELMRPLLSLRRCTVHPTIRNNGRLVLTGVKRNITQAELLEEMVKSTKRECEESHRRIVLGLNGLAGCAWLVGEMASAADYYRQALRSIKEHEEAKKFRTDPLQQIHAMHNLMELLKREQGGVPAACADDQLPDQLAARRQQYLSESCTAFRNASNKLSAIEEKRLVKEEQFGECEGWVAEQVSQAERHQIDGEMTAFVRQTLMEKQGNLPNIKLIFRNGRGLSLAADNRWQELKSGREQLAVAVKEMEGFDFDCEELLHTVVTCHLRPFGGLEHILHSCHLCKTQALINTYEALLYCDSDTTAVSAWRGANEGNGSADAALFGAGHRGTADSALEVAVKALLQFSKLRSTRFDRRLIDAATHHLALFDVYKAEFNALKAIWVTASEYLAKIDEVRMAVERLRLRTAEEETIALALRRNGEEEPVNVIRSTAIPAQQADFRATLNDARRMLDRHLGKLNYLDNLRKIDMDPAAGNTEECPICTQRLGHHWAVMLCGHYYCSQCIAIISKQGGPNDSQIRCAVCRQLTNRANVTFVQTKRLQSDADEDSGVIVLGSYSSKIEAIVRRLLTIKRQTPLAKSLVFSCWNDVLLILSAALKENSITHLCLRSGNRQQDLADFRLNPDISVLLLPVSSGANGLNLVEASHVLFVEPLLNSAAELQAIGRVHRIGQHRATTVHRFIVKGSIEERLYDAIGHKTFLDDCDQSDDSDQWTIAHLAELVSGRG